MLKTSEGITRVPAGIENHSLLANLYLTVLEVTLALINMQNCIRRVQLRFDKTKTMRERAFIANRVVILKAP
jgi:hypothetical protein